MKVQIDEKLFNDLLRYHLMPPLDEDELAALDASIKMRLEQKLDAMVRRELYTKSKTAPTAEEREKARQRYLDVAGILPDWRY